MNISLGRVARFGLILLWGMRFVWVHVLFAVIVGNIWVTLPCEMLSRSECAPFTFRSGAIFGFVLGLFIVMVGIAIAKDTGILLRDYLVGAWKDSDPRKKKEDYK